MIRIEYRVFFVAMFLGASGAAAQVTELSPAARQAPQQVAEADQSGGQTALAKPKAYKAVAVQLPKVVADPSFEPFRRQLADIAKNKDRAALARIIAQNFFWLVED